MEVGHTAVLLLELGAVVFGLGLLGSLAGRIGLSPIPLYLLAGLAFGTGGLLPLDAPEGFFSTGAEVGVVLLLLVLGLEYTAGDLVENLRRQAPVGVADLLLNGLPGAALALFLGWGPTAALALFGVTAISSSGIISKLLTDLGRLGNRETPAVLGVLVIEDLAMAAYLPILTGVVAASSTGDAVLSVTVALTTLAVVLAVAVRHGHSVTRFVGARSNEILLLRVLGLALLVAGAAEAVHVSAAVGAFLLGIALSGEVAERIGDVLSPLRDLFAAVFFVFFGLSTDPTQLPAALLPAAALAAVGIVTKFGTGWIAGRRAGVGPPARVRAGAALVARGEFSIIIAGLVLGSVPAAFGSTVAAYVLILAVLGPLTPRLVDPWVRRLAQRSAPPRSTP
ncbi:cation:proton antiporter [Modestobacter sp. VKM Ac-2978]|uniref:cation:proton antiporter n=1 Tax=Modestobacter sp. VKM Ac-2978 TaxID=3004132 RepID=UPI0022AAF928|nr:cation:proton antiporter [Modestobacter sp. VKM Ac-2978]MCZ2846646.1 cation:proton antiporter [Modestobacter sp. VKM Ac-2978]